MYIYFFYQTNRAAWKTPPTIPSSPQLHRHSQYHDTGSSGHANKDSSERRSSSLGHHRSTTDSSGHHRSTTDGSGHHRSTTDSSGHYRSTTDSSGHYRSAIDSSEHYRSTTENSGHKGSVPLAYRTPVLPQPLFPTNTVSPATYSQKRYNYYTWTGRLGMSSYCTATCKAISLSVPLHLSPPSQHSSAQPCLLSHPLCL